MNKCYRMVFNRCHGVWQAVAESASGHSGGGYKLLLTATLLAVLPVAQAQVASSTGQTQLPELTSGLGGVFANAISADGSTVVGAANFVGTNAGIYGRAFRWSAVDGIQNLGVLSNSTYAYSSASAVNQDGSVVVGSTWIDLNQSSNPTRAFRWTALGGMQELGTLETSPGTASNSSSFARGVNADGSVVVGEAVNDNGQLHAFRWVDGGAGMTQLFTAVDGQNTSGSGASAVNANGNVAVGNYQYSSGRTGAFRWTSTGGVQSLGALDKNTNSNWHSFATGVDAAGNVVVGGSTNGSSDFEAFRWTAGSGMVGLGKVSGFSQSHANAVSANGVVVVGSAYSNPLSNNPAEFRGFRWEAATGIQTIEQWLQDSGVDTSALTEHAINATGVNEDGSIVVGTLSNQRAYIARGKPGEPTQPGEQVPVGLIEIGNLNTSLARTAASAILAENQNDLVFHGLHSNPMQSMVKTGTSAFWTAGDFGRHDRDARDANMAAGEVGFAHRLSDALQLNIAAGQTYSKANTGDGGETRVKGNFVLPEAIVSLPGSLYATFSGMYAKGSAKLSRGYINTGMQDHSYGNPDTRTLGARLRLDWHEAANVHGVALTPFASLSHLRTKIDAYTETGGGFAARWDQRQEKATTLRLGVDAAKPINDKLKLNARIEGVHRFENKHAGASGQVLGLNAFSLDGQKLKQNWLRFGVGLEGKLGNGVASVSLNKTTGGETASYWLAAKYLWQF